MADHRSSAALSAAAPRLVLLACWLFVLGYGMVAGQRPADLGRLQSALSSGSVHTVEITAGLPPGATGSITQDLFWREGLTHFHAAVTMTTPNGDDGSSVTQGNDDSTAPQGAGLSTPPDATEQTGRDIGAELANQYPGLRIIRLAAPPPFWEVYGWRIPPWVGLIAGGGMLGVLALLVAGAPPWRATRWAWFWLLSTPVGLLGFLLLSGPVPIVRAPQEPARRLTGGRALLLAMVLAAVLPHW